MASVAVILLVGRLYDQFNVKVLILVSIAIFEGGSALCGGARSSAALVVGRVVVGMGGARMYLGYIIECIMTIESVLTMCRALTYISVYSTPRSLPIHNALIGLSWGTGAILGPVISGAFSVSSVTWRWVGQITTGQLNHD
jgi:MFS family permease